MEKVLQFLKDAETYYLATVEGNQPRVRPFGTAHIFCSPHHLRTSFLVSGGTSFSVLSISVCSVVPSFFISSCLYL